MSSIDRKIVQLLTMAGSEHALSVLREAGIKRSYTVEDMERVCYLGIQQLPEYRRTEAAGSARLSSTSSATTAWLPARRCSQGSTSCPVKAT